MKKALLKDLDELKTAVAGASNLEDKDKENLIAKVDKVITRIEVPDTMVYRLAVGCIGAVVIILSLGLIYLVSQGQHAVPDALGVGLGTALGALAGMLIPSSGQG